MTPKRKNDKPKKITTFSFFKEQLTDKYLEKYGSPKSDPPMIKSTLNAIMANDFKLPGVEELFAHLKPVSGFQLPDYRKEQIDHGIFEYKGFARTLNRQQPGRVSKEDLARVEEPLRFNNSLWRLSGMEDNDAGDEKEDESAEPSAKKPRIEESNQQLPEPITSTVYAIVREAYDGESKYVFTPRFDGSATLPYCDDYLESFKESDISVKTAATDIFINNSLEKPLYVEQAFTTFDSALQYLRHLHTTPQSNGQMIHRFDLQSTPRDGKLYSTVFETDISGCSIDCGLWSERVTAQAALDKILNFELYAGPLAGYEAKVIEVSLHNTYNGDDKTPEGSCIEDNCVWCLKYSAEEEESIKADK